MKAKIPFFCCLLLVLVCCQRRDSPKRRAYESLDTVVRLYEAGADTIDAELLAPALAYFPSKGDAATNARLWYQWGLITYYRGEYDQAIVSFERALLHARAVGNRHLEGLICRAMADMYNRTYNIREDTVYMRKAWQAFDAEEDSLYRAETALRLVGAYMNARQWDKADRLLQEVLPVCLRNGALVGHGMNVYASYQLTAPSGDPALAARCFEAMAAAGFPQDDDRLCDWGYALYLTGEKDRALRLWDSLDRQHPEGLVQLQYRQYNRYRLEGDAEQALALLERSALRQDSILTTQASEAVSRAQRDYLEAVAEEAVAFQHFPVGHGPFPFLRIVVHAEAQPVVRVPADGALDGALVLGDVAPDDGGVDAVDGMDEELVRQVRLRRRVLGDHQQAARILVDAVHEHAETLVFSVRSLRNAQVVGERVHERPGVVPVPGMDHHPGGLVDDEHVVILVSDVQGNVLRQDFHGAP